MRILPYLSMPAEFRAYDPQVVEVAHLLAAALRRVEPKLKVEHVGSTSVPGCGGKGIVDLAVLYPEDFLARARAILDHLGFQKQGGRDPFPESRPMRVGCVEHDGRPFPIHAHIIALDSDEHRELVFFREALRASSTLRHHRRSETSRAALASRLQDSGTSAGAPPGAWRCPAGCTRSPRRS